MSLPLARFKRKAKLILRDPELAKGVPAMEDVLAFLRVKQNRIINRVLDLLNNEPKVDGRAIIDAMKLLKATQDMILECAHKLAPYQTPKLETLEVKSQVEHRYVIRAPEQMKSADEWMKATGAESMKIDRIQDRISEGNIKPPVQSIHDFDEDEQEFYNKDRLN